MGIESLSIQPTQLSALNDTAVIDCAGYGSVAIALTGTWTGTVTFEGSAAPGQWDAIPMLAAGASSSTATANGTFTNGIGGLTAVRARFSTATSGTVVVYMRVVEAGGSVSITSVGGGSATAANQVLQIAQETATATVLGLTTDAPVGNANGTINAHLRYANSVWASVWDSLNNWLRVSIQNTTLAVTQSGTWTALFGGYASAMWYASHFPSSNTQATASKTSGGGTVRNVCTGFSAALITTGTAPVSAQITWALRDGATGAGTVLDGAAVTVPASAGQNIAYIKGTCWVVGSQATAMTLEWSAAGGANTIESVVMHGTTLPS